MTSCNDVPADAPNTQTTSCSDGYKYNNELFGETTVTTVGFCFEIVRKYLKQKRGLINGVILQMKFVKFSKTGS